MLEFAAREMLYKTLFISSFFFRAVISLNNNIFPNSSVLIKFDVQDTDILIFFPSFFLISISEP